MRHSQFLIFYENFALTCACTTICFSGLVILTGLFFPSMLRKSHFMRLIFTISLCDFFNAILFTVGFPSENGPLCAAQGFISYFFGRCSWFFTAALSFQLYCLLVNGKLILSEKIVHIISWGSSLILNLVVYPYLSYGIEDDYVGEGFCRIYSPSGNTPLLEDYIIGVFIAPLIIATFLLLILAMVVIFKNYIQLSIVNSERHQSLVRTILIYPTTMIIAWLPNIILYLVFVSCKQGGSLDSSACMDITRPFLDISLGWAYLYGAFLGIIFFYNSSEARRRWYNATIGSIECSSDNRVSVYFSGTTEIIEDTDHLVENVSDSQTSSKSQGSSKLGKLSEQDQFKESPIESEVAMAVR